jgi:hypothetical protein
MTGYLEDSKEVAEYPEQRVRRRVHWPAAHLFRIRSLFNNFLSFLLDVQ